MISTFLFYFSSSVLIFFINLMTNFQLNYFNAPMKLCMLVRFNFKIDYKELSLRYLLEY